MSLVSAVDLEPGGVVMAKLAGKRRVARSSLDNMLARLQPFWQSHWRGVITGAVALAAVALMTLGPTAIVMIWEGNTGEAEAAPTYRVGDPVRDGPVTFVVHQVRCGPAEEDSMHGRLCEVTVSAVNEGAEEIPVPSLAQTLHVAEGGRHQPVRPGTGQLGPLEPAQSATAVIRFDLPLAATISHLELRADTYARGVPVAVGTPYPLISD